MSTTIVSVQSPEAREYARYLAEIEERKRRAAELRADLEALTLSVGRFEAEYHARVGVLFVELDQIKLAIAEYEQRISLLQADPQADPAKIEQDIAEKYAGQREEVRAEEEETRRFERAHQRDQARPHLDAGAEDEAKRLYRELVKRFHPDLARTEEERRLRTEIMQRVNAAFHARDVSALEALVAEAEVSDPAFEARSIGEKLVWAIREVARLDGVIEGVTAELEGVRRSESHGLWLRHDQGEDVIERLETDLRQEIGSTRDRLAVLIGVYRHLAEHPA
jgi:hypothetical protein